jgi:hypothetical protein
MLMAGGNLRSAALPRLLLAKGLEQVLTLAVQPRSQCDRLPKPAGEQTQVAFEDNARASRMAFFAAASFSAGVAVWVPFASQLNFGAGGGSVAETPVAANARQSVPTNRFRDHFVDMPRHPTVSEGKTPIDQRG